MYWHTIIHFSSNKGENKVILLLICVKNDVTFLPYILPNFKFLLHIFMLTLVKSYKCKEERACRAVTQQIMVEL